MLVLLSVLRERREIPYEPSMPLGQYMREVIAPALGLSAVKKRPESEAYPNWTVDVRVQEYDTSAGRRRELLVFREGNCDERLGDVLEDGACLTYTFVDLEEMEGNAGTAPLPDGCGICFQKDLSTSKLHTLMCGHMFCCKCLTGLTEAAQSNRHDDDSVKCPYCRAVASVAEVRAWKIHSANTLAMW
jgi:hypothetical protein